MRKLLLPSSLLVALTTVVIVPSAHAAARGVNVTPAQQAVDPAVVKPPISPK